MRLLLILCLALPACGNRQDGTDSGLLAEALNGFNTMIRWQNWQSAAAFVAPKERVKWLEGRLANSPGLHITEVNIAGVTREPPDAEEAVVYVQITWYRMPSTTLQQSLWRQDWKLQSGEGWRLIKEAEAKAEEKVKVAPAPAWP